MMTQAAKLYRERFEPSEQLERPYLILGFNCFAAASDEEAALLSSSVQQAFVALRAGQPAKLQPPRAGYADSLPLDVRSMLSDIFSCSAVGSVATVRRQLLEFVDRTRADELIVTSQIYDHEARLRSYELLMETVRAPAAVED
jgi:alkanesulfonate monooxygenase SsuD/methylene tetrahydromethanopterin reductase-like flavin-dependent oxidoreductase (luciferase family)